MGVTSTSVAIVGAGPAGLLLARLLARAGVACHVLERRSRAHVEGRVRAGVLESTTVEALCEAGVGARLRREGAVHHGIELRFGGAGHRIDFDALVPGHTITVYGQREVVRDLIAARVADASPTQGLEFEVSSVALSGLEVDAPVLEYTAGGRSHRLFCDWVIGCDGSHGVSRDWLPAERVVTYERTYPFAWLGILADVAPSSPELVYALHDRGFALHSMRSPEVSRFYLQVARDEALGAWSDERIWAELERRLAIPGWSLRTGLITEKSITLMRSFVIEPLRHRRLVLAGDAAHIVPATGAKGLNLAVADVRALALALLDWYGSGRSDAVDEYCAACLRRVWRVQHFSNWMTRLLHRLPGDDAYEQRLQLAQLDYLVSSRAAATTLAENYVGIARD